MINDGLRHGPRCSMTGTCTCDSSMQQWSHNWTDHAKYLRSKAEELINAASLCEKKAKTAGIHPSRLQDEIIRIRGEVSNGKRG